MKWLCSTGDCSWKPERLMVACPLCCGYHLPGPPVVAGRDADRGIRLSAGKGELIANADHTRADVQGWHDMATEAYWRQKYAAVLALLDREEAAR